MEKWSIPLVVWTSAARTIFPVAVPAKYQGRWFVHTGVKSHSSLRTDGAIFPATVAEDRNGFLVKGTIR
jgi:hypothetical protein